MVVNLAAKGSFLKEIGALLYQYNLHLLEFGVKHLNFGDMY